MNHKKFFSVQPNDFLQLFTTEEKCIQWLTELKWESGFFCKKCGHNHYCEGNHPGSRRCTKCKTEETIKANTIFQNCKLPLRTSMHMMLYAYHQPDSTTLKMCKDLGIRQMTCWRIKKIVKEFKF